MRPHAVERWLTVAEVAERLRVSRASVYALCERGELRHARVGNVIRVCIDALRTLERQRG